MAPYSARLALLPLGYLARRFSGAPQADLFAGIVYLFTPAYTRSLLLLELSALLGHLLDLIVIAYLARILLELFPARRIVATMVLIAASLAVYTSGFIHQGLLVCSLLILAPLLSGLDRAGAFSIVRGRARWSRHWATNVPSRNGVETSFRGYPAGGDRRSE